MQNPSTITKPIQLIALPVSILLSGEGIFMAACKLINNPSWAPTALLITMIIYAFLSLIMIFILITRYRPEMQEDKYYHKTYLQQRAALDKKEQSALDKLNRITAPVFEMQFEKQDKMMSRQKEVPIFSIDNDNSELIKKDNEKIRTAVKPKKDEIIHLNQELDSIQIQKNNLDNEYKLPNDYLPGEEPTKSSIGYFEELHHVNIPVSDLDRSVIFYKHSLGLIQIIRPDFGFPGAWFGLPSGQQIHLVLNKETKFRDHTIVPGDVHFALRVTQTSWQRILSEIILSDFFYLLQPFRNLNNLLQMYVLDPDNHIIEITSLTQAQRVNKPMQ